MGLRDVGKVKYQSDLRGVLTVIFLWLNFVALEQRGLVSLNQHQRAIIAELPRTQVGQVRLRLVVVIHYLPFTRAQCILKLERQLVVAVRPVSSTLRRRSPYDQVPKP